MKHTGRCDDGPYSCMVAERAGASELRVCAGEGRLRADIVDHFPDIVYIYITRRTKRADEEGRKGAGRALWRERPTRNRLSSAVDRKSSRSSL